MNKQLNKLFLPIIIIGILLAILIWNSIFRQASAQITDGQCKISFLNVGQADAALISLPSNVQVLIDAGTDIGTVSKVESQMPSFDDKIEYVIATHPDSDHIGGMPLVLESYKVGQYIQTNKKSDSKTYLKVQELIKAKNIETHIAQKGETINLSALASAKILSPDESKIESLSSNDSSIVFRFACGKAFAIFSGDAQTQIQDQIARENPSDNLKAQIFKIAHHGAQNAFSKNLMLAVKPEMAVISVGKNSYGHPSDFVLSELKKLSINYLRTDQAGTINFVSNSLVWQKQ